jgi:hypothetical protein
LFVEDFCCEQGIESIVKYREEPWSRYFERLKEWAKVRNHPEEKILKRIRTQWLPRDLKTIFLAGELSLEAAIERTESGILPSAKYKN